MDKNTAATEKLEKALNGSPGNQGDSQNMTLTARKPRDQAYTSGG